MLAASILVAASVFTLAFVVRFLRRERDREVRQYREQVAAEHRERELLETRVKQKETERESEELGRKLLEQERDAARLESRAAEAERAALEMKSQLYASIGIMAGSYAHNIKNLLVRPNDLLTRCIEVNGLSADQEGMLHEVKTTLGTVTERLQQILRTVRRDPTKAEMTRIDLNELVCETQRTWADMAREKWKIRIIAEPCDGPLWVSGDVSHLQQAVENLLFNARDATFEMRNHLREEARKGPSTDNLVRRQKLLEAAAWKGEVVLRTRGEEVAAVLEVRDNGVGMTEEVRVNCLRTHFTTKRDNALYEGLSAGMGLGLSFVAVVLEHHGAALEIESVPLKGTTFRVRLPLAPAYAQEASR
jgi:signal transduction histidine kinase